MESKKPQVTYFVEGHEEAQLMGYPDRTHYLEDVFNDDTITLLQNSQGRVSIATDDISVVAPAVTELNRREIPVDLWPTFPVTDENAGYWKYKGNADRVLALVEGLLSDADRFNIRFERVGCDLEPHISTLRALARFNVFKLLKKIYAEITAPYLKSAQAEFEHAVSKIQEEGYPVDVYKIPYLGDFVLTRFLLGILDVPCNADKIVSMLYSSVSPVSVQWDLKDGEIPGLGIVSHFDGHHAGRSLNRNGIEAPSDIISQERLNRDVAEAVIGRKSDELYCFALNGAGVVQKVSQAIDVSLDED